MMERCDPNQALDPSACSALDQSEQILRAKQCHKRERVKLPNATVHGALHVIVENQIAAVEKTNFLQTTLRVRQKLLWGSVRRLFLNVFRPGYVRASLAQRRGECKRCGACCQLTCKCHFFRDDDCTPSCALYARRPPNCCNFPIDEHDLADRDLVAPDSPCGFWWSHSEKEQEQANK